MEVNDPNKMKNTTFIWPENAVRALNPGTVCMPPSYEENLLPCNHGG